MKSEYEGVWEKPLTKLRGCGTPIFIEHYFASRDGVYRFFGNPYLRTSKKLVLEAERNYPYRPVCGTYMKSSWYRRTRVILCARCVKKMGMEW